MSEFLIAETNDAGEPNLAGKRRLSDDIDDATVVADEIGGTVFVLEPIEPAPYEPVIAVRHVRLDAPDELFWGAA
jgi:hypothetical protein